MKLNLLFVKDFYRRWWWAYLLGFIIFIGVGIGFSYTKNHSALPLAGSAILGVVLLATDLNFRTNARTLLTLPISVKELSASLWFICVPLSGLFVTIATLIGSLIAAGLGATHPLSPGDLLRLFLLTMAVGAFMLVVLTFLLHRQPENFGENLIAGMAGGAWGLGFSAGIAGPMAIRAKTLWDPISLCILLVGILCAIVAWYRCSVMLRNRTRRMGSTAVSTTPRSTTLPTGGLSGLSWLFARTFGTAAGFSIVMLLVMQVILRILRAPVNGQTVSAMIFLPLFFISILLLQPQLTTLRHWRSLPLTSSHLALLYLGLSLVTILGALSPLTVYVLVGGGFSAPWLSSSLLVFGTGVFCMLLSLIMRHGIKWALFVPLLFIPLFAALPLALYFKEIAWAVTESPLTLLAGLGLMLLAYLWNLRTLRKRSQVYQSNFHLMGRMQMGG